MSKICTFNTAGFCTTSNCPNSHNGKSVEVNAFEFYTLWECNQDSWIAYQKSKGLDEIIVKSKKTSNLNGNNNIGFNTDSTEINSEWNEDYNMDLNLDDNQNHTSNIPQSIEEEREQIRQHVEERKRKRDLELLELQKKEEEELERIRIAREKIKQQMQEKYEQQNQLEEKNEIVNTDEDLQNQISNESSNQTTQITEEIDLGLILDINPMDIPPIKPIESLQESNSETLKFKQEDLIAYDKALISKWNKKINFNNPRIPLMAPGHNLNSVSYKTRQKVLEMLIPQFDKRFQTKRAILYAFETEDRLYKRYADQKTTYWMTGLDMVNKMGGSFNELSLLNSSSTNTSTDSTTSNMQSKIKIIPQNIKKNISTNATKNSSKTSATKAIAPKKSYCICGKDETYDSNMIQCEYENCEKEWFHFKCMGIKSDPEGSWYCPDHKFMAKE